MAGHGLGALEGGGGGRSTSSPFNASHGGWGIKVQRLVLPGVHTGLGLREGGGFWGIWRNSCERAHIDHEKKGPAESTRQMWGSALGPRPLCAPARHMSMGECVNPPGQRHSRSRSRRGQG